MKRLSSHSVVSDSLQPHGQKTPRALINNKILAEENQPAKQKQGKTRRKKTKQNIAHTQSTVTTTSSLFLGGQILFTI